MVARSSLGGVATLALAALLTGCEPEPSIAPSVLKATQAEAAALRADLAKAEEQRATEQARVKDLLREVRAARELISGRESDAIERRHYDETLLRRASAEVDQLLLGTRLLKALQADKSADAARAREAVEEIAPRPFKTLVELHQAQAALLKALPVLLQGAQSEGKDLAAARARYMREIDELRVHLTRQEDESLRLARDHDIVRRKLQLAREALEKIAEEGDAGSQKAAKSGLEASRLEK